MSYNIDVEDDYQKPLLFDSTTQNILDQFEMQLDQFRIMIRDLASQLKIFGTMDDSDKFRDQM
jgi:hypothetical protein